MDYWGISEVRAKKIDANQPYIVAELLKIPGVSVEVDHDDILVGYKGVTYWYEIKSEDKVKKLKDELAANAKTKSQKKLDQTWTGHREYVWKLEQILEDIWIEKK